MVLKRLSNRFKKIFELSLQLAKTNFKLRNEGSYLGILWYLLEPLLLFLILIFISSSFVMKGGPNYPIYLLIGLITFNFFRKATVQSASSISGNSEFIKNIKIPHESLVISRVIEGIFSHFFEIILLIFFMFFYKISFAGLIFYPLILAFLILFILGISFILSTLSVYVNDLNNVWNVLTTLLWFVTPIFYFVEEGSRLYMINLFNPMFYFITIMREVLIYQKVPELWMILVAVNFSLLILIIGFLVFGKYRNKFAEML